MVTRIGLDLGYANITLSDLNSEIFREPSVALVAKDTRRIISVGSSALAFEGALPENAILVRPFKNGLLFDYQITSSVIKCALKEAVSSDRTRCIVGIPSDFVPKQEKELFTMLNQAGVTDCFAVNRAVAALIGAGYSPDINALSVNIGASTTEIALFNEGNITNVTSADVGGEDFDIAVKEYILKQGDVNVSLSVARAIKERLGSVWRGKEPESIDIEGTLALTGNRVKMTLNTEDIVGVFENPLRKIIMAVADSIKKIPLDNVEKIFKNGIVLTGGGAMIYGLEMMMSKVLGIPVTKPEDAIDSVAKGLSIINSFIPVKGRATNKNITYSVAKYYEDNNKKSED
jgi:rod shape-determining protein MreB